MLVLNEIECIRYLMYKVKVCRNDLEYNNNMYMDSFIELYEIRKMIENKEKKCR